MQNEKKISKTFNYAFSQGSLKELVDMQYFDLKSYYDNEDDFKIFINKIVEYTCYINSMENLEYLNLNFDFVKGSKKYGVVIHLPDAKHECDSNMIAIVSDFDNKHLDYYTSEIFHDLGYGVYLTKNRSRYLIDMYDGNFEELKKYVLDKEYDLNKDFISNKELYNSLSKK